MKQLTHKGPDIFHGAYLRDIFSVLTSIENNNAIDLAVDNLLTSVLKVQLLTCEWFLSLHLRFPLD